MTVNPEEKDPVSDKRSGKDSVFDDWINIKDGCGSVKYVCHAYNPVTQNTGYGLNDTERKKRKRE